MAPLFKSLLGNSARDREVAEDMRAILLQMQQERTRHEAVVERVRLSVERLQQLGEPLARAGSDLDEVAARIEDLEQRLAAFAELESQLQRLDEHAAALAQNQQRAETEVSGAIENATRIRAVFDDLSQKVDLACALKDQLTAFLEVEKPFALLRGDAEGLRSQVEGTGDHMARLREQHERLLDAHKLSVSKMEALERRREELSRDLQDKERRVATVEQAVRGMDGIQHTVDDVKRDMGTLKALGDFVAQKSAALEAQRESVETALARADHLDRAIQQVDAGVRQQQENERSLASLEDQVSALRLLHETVIERSREITQLQREADERAHATRQDLAAVQDEMKKTVERFDFESRGLESVTRRVADLRGAVSDFESRFSGLSESSHTVGELKAQTRILAGQIQTLSEDAARIDGEAARLHAIRRELDEMARVAGETRTQVVRIEEARPAVEAAVRDLEHLSGAHAMVGDALEQTRLAHTELVRLRESQSDTRSWLTNVEQFVGELNGQVGELRRMSPVVEEALEHAQRIDATLSSVESQREFIEELQRRIADLGTQGGSLEERGRQLHSRMDAAEQRFVELAAQADEAQRMTGVIHTVASRLDESERDAAKVRRSVAAVESRCQSVEGLGERTESLRQELEQRQRALEAATRDLERASKLREEAADSAQQLDELTRRLTGALAAAEKRVTKIDTLSAELEDRGAGLRAVDRRLGQFEERLAKWELVEQEISRSLEQIAARQGTVESLQTDLERMFTMAEETATHVRAITATHGEVEETRRALDDVRARLQEVRETTSSLDERKRQMAKAEERLARAEALIVDVRSSLEALEEQRAIVDQAVEKAGSLQYLLKQAEATIEGLREERKMATRIRAAVAVVREHEQAEGGSRVDKAA